MRKHLPSPCVDPKEENTARISYFWFIDAVDKYAQTNFPPFCWLSLSCESRRQAVSYFFSLRLLENPTLTETSHR